MTRLAGWIPPRGSLAVFVGGSGTDISNGGPGTDRAERDPFDAFLSVERLLG